MQNLNQNHQQLPQHSQKVKKLKQQTIIRKITLQSIGPVIQKVQQHIGYLLNQTKLQRQRNQQLIIAVADHNLLRQRMDQVNLQMDKINEKFQQLLNNRKNDIFDNEKGNETLRSDITSLKADLKRKQNKIKQLQGSIGQQIKIQRQDKQSITELIEQIDRKISETQENSLNVGNKNTHSVDLLSQKLKTNDFIIKQTKMLFDQSNRIIKLYLDQRDSVKQQNQKIWQKLHRAIDKVQYEKDRMTIRAENQILRKNIKGMIDSALTPDVRSFLPVMLDKIEQISRLPQIQKISKEAVLKIQNIQNNLLKVQSFQKYVDEKFKSVEENFNGVDKRIRRNAQDIFLNKQNILDLQDKREQLKHQLEQSVFEINQTFKKIQMQLIDKINKSQNKLNLRIQGIAQEKKKEIYEVVDQQVPQQIKKFYQNLKKVIPTIQETKNNMMDRCDSIQKFGQTLQKQLQAFSNKTTKMKSNLSIQINTAKQQVKKVNERIDSQQQNMNKLGKLLSNIMQIIITSLASGTSNYDQQVYVTYNDGIILQSDINLKPGQLIYRRKKMIREDLRKSLLTSSMQLIDYAIKDQSLTFINWDTHKPSLFFNKHIFKNYQKIQENKIRKMIKLKQQQKDSSQTTKINDQIDRSFQIDMSKTIEPIRPSRHKKNPSGSLSNNDPKKNFNVKLKKLDNQRYSSLKQDY